MYLQLQTLTSTICLAWKTLSWLLNAYRKILIKHFGQIFYATLSKLRDFCVILWPVWLNHANFLQSERLPPAYKLDRHTQFTGSHKWLRLLKGDHKVIPMVKISPYRLPTQPRRGWPHHQGLCPLLLSNSGVGSFTSHKNQMSKSAVRRDVWFFILIQED